jgi:NADH-quinone oxidoreductase subunit G
MLRRVHARFHPDINRYFICDRGRYGYEFVNDARRLREPQAGRSDRRTLSWEDALRQAQQSLAGCRRVLGIGSPRASLEANFALKALVGDDAFSPGLSAVDQEGLAQAIAILREGPAHSACLAEVEAADAIFVLGTDPTNEAPMLDLAIRQASHRAALETAQRLGIPEWNDYPVRDASPNARGPLYLAAVAAMKLEAIATEAWRAAPPELADLGWAVERAVREQTVDEKTLAGRIAQALASAQQPLVIASAGDIGLLRAAAAITRALHVRGKPCLLFIVTPECNSVGAVLLGGRSLDDTLDEIESGRADGLIVLENDLFRRASPRRIAAVLGRLKYLAVLDCLATPTTAAADLALPAATFAEATGTLVNNEGRAQRYYQVFVPQDGPRPAWRILRDLIEARKPGAAPWAACEQVTVELARANPALAAVLEATPPASWRDGTGARIARMTHRHSGRAAETADRTVFEPQPPTDPDSPFAFSMEGLQAEPPAALIPRYWYPGWNSVQALNRFEIEAPGLQRREIPGKRLLDPGPGSQRVSPAEPEPPLEPDEIWLVPRAAIFGSEELSRVAPGIASLTPPAAVRLHPDEAARRSLAEGDPVKLQVAGEEWVLAARLDAGVAAGVAVVPAGYPETAGILGACRARIGKAR